MQKKVTVCSESPRRPTGAPRRASHTTRRSARTGRHIAENSRQVLCQNSSSALGVRVRDGGLRTLTLRGPPGIMCATQQRSWRRRASGWE